jgi:hypothetical protein
MCGIRPCTPLSRSGASNGWNASGACMFASLPLALLSSASMWMTYSPPHHPQRKTTGSRTSSSPTGTFPSWAPPSLHWELPSAMTDHPAPYRSPRLPSLTVLLNASGRLMPTHVIAPRWPGSNFAAPIHPPHHPPKPLPGWTTLHIVPLSAASTTSQWPPVLTSPLPSVALLPF